MAVPPARTLVNIMICFSLINIDENVCSLESHSISNNLLLNLRYSQME